MHYSLGVVIDSKYGEEELWEAVDRILYKFDDSRYIMNYYSDGTRMESPNEDGHLDWYTVGGRWDGNIILKSTAYNPEELEKQDEKSEIVIGLSKKYKIITIGDSGEPIVGVNVSLVKDIDFELTSRPYYLLSREMFATMARNKNNPAFYYLDRMKEDVNIRDAALDELYQQRLKFEKNAPFYAIIVDGEWYEFKKDDVPETLLCGHENDWLVIIDCHS